MTGPTHRIPEAVIEEAEAVIARSRSRSAESSPLELPPSIGPTEKSCYQRAVDLLSRRAHFTAELRRKLSQRHFEDEEIDEACRRLESEGYLNDGETTFLWVEQQLRRKPQGSRKLLAGLLRRGVDSETARSVLSQEVDPREGELIQAAVERWSNRSGSDHPEALKRYLDRLGFRSGTVIREVRKLRALQNRSSFT